MANNTLCTEERLHWTARGPPRCTPDPKLTQRILEAEQEDAGYDFQERTRRQDLRYLQRHPEVRAITAMIIELALTFRPATPVSVFFSEFFSRPREEIERKLQPFLETQTYEQDGRFKRRETTTELLEKESEGLMVDKIEEKRTTERSQLLKSLDRMRKNMHISLTEMPTLATDVISIKSVGAASLMPRSDEVPVGSPTGSIAVSEVTAASSQQSLIFSQSIEDFLISLQVKKRGKEEAEEISSPYGSSRPSRSQLGTKIVVAATEAKNDITGEEDRDKKLKTIRDDVGNRPRRPLVVKQKSGLYTVQEVDEVD